MGTSTKRQQLDLKRYIGPVAAIAILTGLFLFTAILRPAAQRPPKTPGGKKKVIPEVIILGKGSKPGQVRFNHVKHNSGEYSISGPILCIECHHVAQPASELAAEPPYKTVWPAGRTTTLTPELFAEDPIKAGVAACRDCHVRPGRKPKLMDAMPSIEDPETKEVTKITNQVAFHTACDVCHFQIKFRADGSKAPEATTCSACHKPIAKVGAKKR